MQAEFILYVRDQARSATFYRTLLGLKPSLNIPGMTEFTLPGCKLGLMPERSIAKIISGPLPDPASASGVPRCELYLEVEDLDEAAGRAAQAGALVVDKASDRDRGHRVAYCSDPDGHVIALAKAIPAPSR